jgi:hypothetical protein
MGLIKYFATPALGAWVDEECVMEALIASLAPKQR